VQRTIDQIMENSEASEKESVQSTLEDLKSRFMIYFDDGVYYPY
jgi:hypothetical protein